MKNKRKNFCIMLVTVLLLSSAFIVVQVLPVQAAAVNVPENLNGLSGNAAYLAAMENYYLDLEETDLFETGYKMLNDIANTLFNIVCWVGKATSVLFYYCMKFDLSELFADQINAIQSALNSGFFKPLFNLGFCGAAIIIIKNMLRRDMIGIMGQLGKVVGIFVLSLLVVSHSSTVLSNATGITKSISAQILSSMQGNDNTSMDSFAAASAGTIWANMVHQPWLFLEFGNDEPDEGLINDLLSTSYNHSFNPEGRASRIEDYSGTAFSKERVGEKLGFLILYLIPLLIKCVIYIVLAILTLGFQLFAVFYILLAPVILILIMFPGYESMLGTWLKKLIETQLGILTLSFILGLLVMVDNLLFTSCGEEWGWFTVLIVQTVIAVFVIVKRNELLNMIGKVQRAASTPGYATAMLKNQSSNAALTTRNIAVDGGKKVMKAAKAVAPVAGAAAGMTATTAGTIAGTIGVLGKGKKIAWMDGVVAYSEDYAEYKKAKKKSVERPVMTSQNVTKSERNASNASVSSPEPQKPAQRPRMDSRRVIQVEPVEGHLERVERHGEIEGKKPKVERPMLSNDTGNSMKPKEQVAKPKRESRQVIPAEVRPKRLESHEEIKTDTSKVERPIMKQNQKVTQSTAEPSEKATTGAAATAAKQSKKRETAEGTVRPETRSISQGLVGTKIKEEHAAKTALVKRPQSSVPLQKEKQVSGANLRK